MAQYHYVFTLNNYTNADIENLVNSVGTLGITYICFGKEVAPTTGTPHLQGYLQCKTDNKLRFKKLLRNNHITPAKAESGPSEQEKAGVFGTPYTAIGYAMKEGKFTEAGDAIAFDAKQQGKRSDLLAVKRKIDDGESFDAIRESHFEVVAKYPKFIESAVSVFQGKARLAALQQQFDSVELKPWQQDLATKFQGVADSRKAYWYWCMGGGSGKSWMAKYLVAKMNACYITQGKKADLAYIYAQDPKPIVVINLSRTADPEQGARYGMDALYSFAEDLKDGIIVSTKYESKTVIFEPPHVVFFANFEADYTKWSADRYDVVRLD